MRDAEMSLLRLAQLILTIDRGDKARLISTMQHAINPDVSPISSTAMVLRNQSEAEEAGNPGLEKVVCNAERK